MHSTTGARVSFGKCKHLPHLDHSREKKHRAGRKEGEGGDLLESEATPPTTPYRHHETGAECQASDELPVTKLTISCNAAL